MYAYSSRQTSLHADDIAAVQALYGPRSGPLPTPFPKWPDSVDLGNLTGASTYRTRSGTVNRLGNDDDYRRFTLTRTRGMSIVLSNLSADADLYVENAWGRTIYRSIQTGRQTDFIFPTLKAGTYYTRVDAFDGGTIRYRLSYTTFEQTDIGNLTGQFGLRSYRGTVNAASDEFDGFRFRLSRAGTVSFVLSNLSANANLRLINASGVRIAISARTGTSTDSITRRLSAGTYIATVDAVDRGTIRYRLSFGHGTLASSLASNEAAAPAASQPPPWRDEAATVGHSLNSGDKRPVHGIGGMLAT